MMTIGKKKEIERENLILCVSYILRNLVRTYYLKI